MEWRGVSDDISRGPIPSLAYLKTQIRTLAEYKINLVGFNMEHVFNFQTQSLVAPRDPKEAALTPPKLRNWSPSPPNTTSPSCPSSRPSDIFTNF